MARKVLITRRDWMQETGVVLSNGSWSTNLPLANILDERPQFVAEAADATSASTKFDVDLGAARSIGLFHFQNLITTSAGTVRVRAGNDNTFAVTLYDSTAVSSWAAGADDLEFPALGRPRFFVPFSPISARYIRVEIVDTGASTPLQVGYFGACQTWEPPRNVELGWTITVLDETASVQKVPGGSTYVTQLNRSKRRRLAFGLGYFDDSSMYTQALPIGLIAGRSTPIAIVPIPDDTANLERQAVWGLLSSDPQFLNPFYALYTIAFQLDQLI